MTQHTKRSTAFAALRGLRPIVAAAVALAVFAGCGDKSATGPKDEDRIEVTGTYELMDIGGNRPPVAIYEGPWNTGEQTYQARVSVVGGVVELTEDGEYLIVLGLLAEVGDNAQPVPLSDEGEFTVKGDRIILESTDPQVGTWEGKVKRDALSFELDLLDDGHPIIYRFEK